MKFKSVLDTMRFDWKESQKLRKSRPQEYYVFLFLLVVVLLTGGSARGDVTALIVLRPVSVAVAVWAMVRCSRDNWIAYRSVIAIFFVMLALTLLHLVPLPPSMWQALPGRALIERIDAYTGQAEVWRPMSLSPKDTVNAFFSLFTPIAFLFLAINLDRKYQKKLVVPVFLAIMLTLVFGLIQAVGIDIRIYRYNSEMSGIFANRNHQAVMLAVSLLFLPLLSEKAEGNGVSENFFKFVAALFILLIAIILMITGSRMGIIVFFVSLIMLYFVSGRRDATRGPKSLVGTRLVAGLIVLSIATVGALVWFTSRDVALSRMVNIVDSSRIEVWDQIVAGLPQFLPWGSGVGSYVAAYQTIESASALSPSYSNHAHNDWLELVFTTGIPGIVILLLWLWFFGTAWASEFFGGNRANPLRRIGLAMALVFAIASMVDYPLRTPILASLAAIAAVWTYRPNGRSDAVVFGLKHE